MNGILKKLSAGDGTIFKDIEEDIAGEIPNAIKSFIPNLSENSDEIKKAIEYVLNMIKSELGDDESIGIIRNIDDQLIISVLKSKETDIDIKDADTITNSFNVSEIIDMFDSMNAS